MDSESGLKISGMTINGGPTGTLASEHAAGEVEIAEENDSQSILYLDWTEGVPFEIEHSNLPIEMALAIADVYPNSSHRICKWHVLKKAKENLGNIFSKRSTFKEDFNKVLNQSLTVKEFEHAWKEIICKYGLENSSYLKHIWDIRERWAFPYFADLFYAGMTTTQRSECANHVFKMFVTPSCSMSGFVRRYEIFFIDRLQVEDAEEFQTEHNKIYPRSRSPIERHASKIYTRAVFDLFSKQLDESLSFMVQPSENENVVKVIYLGGETCDIWRRKEFEVYADSRNSEYCCACKLFEHKGLLCCHILRVMIQFGVCQIPERYILKRWTKDARENVPPNLFGYKDDADAAASRTYRQAMLHRSCAELARLGNTNIDTYKKTMDVIGKLVVDLKRTLSLGDDGQHMATHRRSERQTNYSQHIEVGGNLDGQQSGEDNSEEVSVLDIVYPPLYKRGRGRPKVKRIKSCGEEACIKKMKAGKKGSTNNMQDGEDVGGCSGMRAGNNDESIIPPGPPRYCGECGGEGHNARTCGKLSSYVRKYHYK